MFYSLFQYLNNICHFPGVGLWQYLSFRSIVAFTMALLTSMWFGKWFIAFLRKKNISEKQRDEKIDPFNTKKIGVPTMGGIVIIVAILIAVLLVGKLSNLYMLLMIISTLLLGTLGFLDDYIKTFKHNKEGLNGWFKIAGQVLLGLIIGLTLRFAPAAVMNEKVDIVLRDNTEVVYKTPDVKSTRTTIPFIKNHNANYADLFFWMDEPYKYWAGWTMFIVMIVLAVSAVSNGANLNDGMDGMCAGNSVFIGFALLLLAYVSGSVVWADYFDVMYIPGSGELVVYLGAFVGALIGFLWYNAYPAQIFMGDTGSLTIGGIIAVCACIIHKELLLPILCGIFLIESLSVIIQTQVFKLTKKKGQPLRVWKRTPIHDHFRTALSQVDPNSLVYFKGSNNLLHENKITIRFWLVTILFAAFAILTLKIR